MFKFVLNKSLHNTCGAKPRLIKILPNAPYTKPYGIFLCQITLENNKKCDTKFKCLVASVKSGRTKSCGCLTKAGSTSRKVKHGHKPAKGGTNTYNTWMNMLRRCNNPENKHYKNYGGRGIKVCEEWYTFLNFLNDMGERPKKLTIERINNDKGYYKENCKWGNRLEQAANRRNVKLVKYNNNVLPIETARRLSGTTLSIQAINARISEGKTFEEAINIKQKSRRYVIFKNKEISLSEACRRSKTKWSSSIIGIRLNSGMTFEEAIAVPRINKK